MVQDCMRNCVRHCDSAVPDFLDSMLHSDDVVEDLLERLHDHTPQCPPTPVHLQYHIFTQQNHSPQHAAHTLTLDALYCPGSLPFISQYICTYITDIIKNKSLIMSNQQYPVAETVMYYCYQ